MAEEEALRSNEDSALDNNQIISSVSGGKSKKNKTKIKKGLSAAIFITIMLVLLLVFFSSGNLIPSAISERLVEVTDVQYADAVKTKSVVFQQALASGEVPTNTAERLAVNGVKVGNVVNGTFVESENGTSLQYNDKVISASEFSSEVSTNAGLYDAFNSATYSRAGYYYDSGAQESFRRMGISRNNFSSDGSFEEVMTEVMGEGNNITVQGGETRDRTIGIDDPISGDCYEIGVDEVNKTRTVRCDEASSVNGQSAAELVNSVGNQNKAYSSNQATLNAADSLSVADSISQEQRSGKFYVAIMENISKMKAGDGNESQINEAMNYLYREEKSTVVDVTTGEQKVIEGSMLESPSLYSVLSGEKMSVGNAANYSSERILRTVENQGVGKASDNTLSTTLAASTSSKGTIGRWMSGGSMANNGTLSAVTPTVANSLTENSFENIKGINGGELLVQGAVNVGASLALQSGATLGDDAAVKNYARVTAEVLALDAEVDRMKRSPFDITSKNTFLGSIMYKFAVSTIKSGSLLNRVASFSKVTASSVMSLFPMANADDEDVSYMTAIGNCEHMGSIGAAGTAACARNETFDMSTLSGDIFNNPVVQENVTCNAENVCRINDGSDFEEFVKYNVKRTTPAGVTDGSILESLDGSGSANSGTFSLKNLWNKFISWLTGENKRNTKIASGEMYVNKAGNSDWNTTYKYAQRYLSVVRATDALRQYDGDKTAYSNIPYVGVDNPVIACLEKLEREEKALAAANE